MAEIEFVDTPAELKDHICKWLDGKAAAARNAATSVQVNRRELDRYQVEARIYAQIARHLEGITVLGSAEHPARRHESAADAYAERATAGNDMNDEFVEALLSLAARAQAAGQSNENILLAISGLFQL